jgi:hypothetical protein
MTVEAQPQPAEAVSAEPVAVDAPADAGVEVAPEETGGEEMPEAAESEERPRGKPSKAKAEALKFSQLRKLERQMRELSGSVHQEREARERAERERDEAKAERERLVDSFKRDHVSTLRELGVPREEILARQTEEEDIPPRAMHYIKTLEQRIEGYAKRFDEAFRGIEEREARVDFDRRVSSDTAKVMALVPELAPEFAALPEREQMRRADAFIRDAVRRGIKGLTHKDVVEALNEDCADDVRHIRSYGQKPVMREAPERRASNGTPKAPTRAVGARGKSEPAATGPMTEAERREFAIQRARERRLERELAELAKAKASQG